MKKILITSLIALSFFGTVKAEGDEELISEKEEIKEIVEEPTCKSSFRVYNNTSQTVIIHNAQDIDTVPSGSYSYTYGECGTPVQYSVDGEYKLNDGSSATCSYKADGTRNYPSTNGAVESIGLTALCGNEEKSVEIKSFTNTQYKYSGWSNSGNPKEYVYGLKLKATNPTGNMKDVEFTLTDKDGNIMQDMSGKDAIITTDENGEATIYLYAGYSYFVKETKTDEKWSILNGDIIINNTNATVVKADEFVLNKFEEYYSITFENQISEAEKEIQEKISAKKEELKIWQKQKLASIEQIFNDVDKSNYNENAVKESVELKQQTIEELNAYVEKTEGEIEEVIRSEKEINFIYDLDDYETTLEDMNGHWIHWTLLGLFVLCFGLHFVFNKHLMIDLFIIPGIVLYLRDICNLSKVFLVGIAVSSLLFTFLEIILRKKMQKVSEK